MEKRDFGLREGLVLVVVGVTLFVSLWNLKTMGYVFGIILGLFMPIIVGGIIAFILNVPMVFFEKRLGRTQRGELGRFLQKAKTPISLIITLTLMVVVIGFIGKVIFPNMAESIKNIIQIVEDNYQGWIAVAEGYGVDLSQTEEWLSNLEWDSLLEQAKENSKTILSTIGQAATGVIGVLGNIFIGLIFAIYILLNKKKLGGQAKKLAYAYLPKSWADEACYIADLSYKTFSGFLSGQCLEAVILGSMFFITLLVGGFPYAGSIAVIIGCMSIIPFIGAFIGMAFGFLMLAVLSFKKALWFLLVFFIIQQIEGHIVYPKVVGGSVGLPALWTLLAIVVGGKVSGIFGIILCIPLFSVLYALTRRDVYKRLREKKLMKKLNE